MRWLGGLALLLIVAACGRGAELTPLSEIPDLDPAGVEAAVASHLKEIQQSVGLAGPGEKEIAAAWFEFARVYHAYGQFPAARTGYRNTLVLQPDHADARYLLGVTQSRLFEAESAYATFEAARDSCERQTVQCSVEPATLELALAEAAYALGDVDTALHHARRARSYRPADATVWIVQARAEREQGRIDDAILSLERARLLAPEANSFFATLASLHELNGDSDSAAEVNRLRGDRAPLRRDALQAALEDLKRGSQWAIRQAERAFSGGRFDEAARFYREALESLPNDATALLGLAASQLRLNQADAAISVLERLVAVEPALAKAWLNLGSAYTLAGNDVAAQDSLNTALSLSPDYLLARIQLAKVHCAFGRPDAAITEIQRLWDEADDRPRYALLAAQCLLEHQRFEAVFDWIAQGLAVRPDEMSLLGVQVLLQAAAPVDRLRDGHAALSTARALLERQSTFQHKHLEALALAETGATDGALAIMDSLLAIASLPPALRETLVAQRDAFARGEAWRL